jgi:predicted DNA-binding transcriptional regulator AlpA
VDVLSEDKGFLTARKTRERYGVTDMTLYRWLRDERMGFPKPIYFGRFRYFRIPDLENWERRMERGSKPEAA